MRKYSMFLVIVLVVSGFVYACINEKDRYSAGVLFNNDETMDIRKIETIGKSDVNYFKQCTAAQPVASAKPIVVLTPEIRVDMHTDAVKVDSISVEGNTLVLKIAYGGGCKIHEFNMYASSAMGKSIPPVLSLTLSHNADSDMCEAYLRETVNFDLTSLAEIITGYSSARLSIQVPQGDGTFITKYAEWYLQNTCSVMYRSHSAPEMLVTLEYVPHYLTNEVFPSLRLTSDPSIQTLVKIDYSKAVVTELQWLTETGVIQNFNTDKINRISEKLKDSENWYWTKQDSVISYNGVFTYKRDDNGVLIWGDVYMNSLKNGCGSYTDFALPSESLGASAVAPVLSGRSTLDALTVTSCSKGIQINNAAFAGSTVNLQVAQLNGRVVLRRQMMFSESGTAIVSANSIHSGVYNVIADVSGTRRISRVVVP